MIVLIVYDCCVNYCMNRQKYRNFQKVFQVVWQKFCDSYNDFVIDLQDYTLLCGCKQRVYKMFTRCIHCVTYIAGYYPVNGVENIFTMMKWFYVSWKVKVKLFQCWWWSDFTLTFWRNEKVNYFCENIFVVYTSCLHTSQRYYPVIGVNKLYEYTIICFAGVRKVYTTCIYTAYTLHTQSQRYIFAMV